MSPVSRLPLLGAAALLLSSLAAVQTGNAAPAGDAKNGQKLFTADGCYECHNGVAQGAPMAGPRIGPNPVPFESFMDELRHPRSEMPPYEASVLPDQQAADIYAYLSSLPQPRDAKSIPLLNEN